MKLERLGPLSRIVAQLKDYYPVIIIYSILISVLTLATPISVQSLVNTFSFGPMFQPIFLLSVLLLGLLAVLGVLKSLQYLMVEYLQRQLYAKVTSSISRAYFMGEDGDREPIREKANRYLDVILIQKKLAFLVTDGIALGLQTFIGLILISFYHPFFIVFSILILVSLVIPLYVFGTKGLGSAVNESTYKYKVADFITGLSRGALANEPLQAKVNAIDNQVEAFLDARSEHFTTVFTQNIIYLVLYAVLNAVLLALGGYLVIKNQLSVGQLVAAEIVVNAILSSFVYAQKYLEAFYDLYAAASKVHLFFDFIDQHRAKNPSDEKDRSFFYAREQEDFQKHLHSLKTIYSPRKDSKLVKRFVLSTTGVILLFLVTPWQQTSQGYGQVTAFDPNDRVQQITATVSGLVEEWLVQDGQVVKKGDPIVRVIDNDPNYLVRLEARRDAAVAKFEAAKVASDTARLNFHRQEQLVKEGLSSQKEFEQSKITYKKLQSEEASAVSELAKAEVDLSRQQLQAVTAPRDGQILRILQGSGTTNVKVGDALVDFVPDTQSPAVELFVDGNDLPLIHEGRKVRLQFEGWPAIQFSGWPSVAIGSFGGVVTVVDPSVSADGNFRILVKPDPDDGPWPSYNILRQGSRSVGIVILEQVSLGYEFWRQINGFPKSMDTPLTLMELKGKGAKKE